MNKGGISRELGLTLVVLATGFWSTSGIFITLVIRESGMTAVALAFWRDISTFACLFIGLRLFAPHLLRVDRRDLPWLAAMGALSIALFHATWNLTVILNGVAVANVFQANAPIIVTLLAWVIWREPLSGRKVAAIALAFGGTVLISRLQDLGQIPVNMSGIVVGLIAATAYGSLSLFGKKLSGHYSAWTILVYAFGFGALFLLPLQINQPPPWPVSPRVLLYFVGLVGLTTIAGFAFYTTGLRGLQASVAAITATSELPFATALSYLLLGERLELSQVLGAGLVVLGVVLVSLPPRRWRPGVRSRGVQPAAGEEMR